MQDTKEKNMPYECDLCNAKLPTASAMSRHEKKHKKYNSHWCKLCNIHFFGQCYFAKHMAECHFTTEWVYCNMCDLKYKFLTSLNFHKAAKHGNCNEINTDRHHSDSDNTVSVKYIYCDICSLKYKTQSALNKHNTSKRHKNRILEITNTNMNKTSEIVDSSSGCEINNIKSSIGVEIPTNINEDQHQGNGQVKRKIISNKHTKPNQNTKLSAMQKKNFKPKSKTVMSKHQNQTQMREFVPKARTIPAVVSRIPKNPQSDSDVPYFILLDEEPKSGCMIPYKCDICGMKQINYLSGLKHANMHRQTNKCLCKQCDKEFLYPALLSYHKKQYHPKIKRFQCGHCDELYKNKWSLQEHIGRIHMQPLIHQNKCFVLPIKINRTPYCHLCKQVFNTEESYEEHNDYLHQM